MSGIGAKGLIATLNRGPFQNNGATPWYCIMGVGSPPQPLYFCFDTGSNFNWVTSSLCGSDGCQHYAGQQFQIDQSASFEWISDETQNVSFGPWGTMQAELGSDVLTIGGATTLKMRCDLLLVKGYQSPEFEQLDWDGGIGLGSHQVSSEVSHTNPFRFYQKRNNSTEEFDFFLRLINAGIVSRDCPYMSFLTQDSEGYVGFGLLDESYSNSLDYVFLPWECYQAEASYLWSTPNASIGLQGSAPVGTQLFFALDSGSSQFKGDNTVLTKMYELTKDSTDSVVITLSDTAGKSYTELTVPASIYQCYIEAGEQAGQTLSQFKGLEGADGMLLVGSVLMDHLYTVYEYQWDESNDLSPVGMWIFNKPGDYPIISNKQSKPAAIFSR
ncbi:pepsin-like aspartic protease [Vibrio viridaestus]|uniref:Pepsinogen n=1 Tax=Vibrio viridaestus TaxID=2487322 RepID=A0A3N9TBE3_9VIBR|nr:pepsin-like aspartic protease [Vibrio viridaestus]RQW61084.1 pepsinogen [Vibrio viridaestus]